MKYDVLEKLKGELYSACTPNTAKKYYAAVVKLFRDMQFNDVSEIQKDCIESHIKEFKSKNEFSAVKNGLKHLKKIYPTLQLPSEDTFRSISIKKRNYSKKPKKNIYLDEVKRKINQMDNDKLKYAYRLALVSGLRVSELAALEAPDLEFKDGIIEVNVQHGKGGHNGKIECLKDEYLYGRLQKYVTDHPEGGLFYTEVYMREKADALGLECHDFRRIFAITCRNEMKKNMPVQEANSLTQEKLRHERFSTTKRYLFNKKLVIKRKKGDEDNGLQI